MDLKQTTWTKRKTERGCISKKRQEDLSILREIEEKKEERAHKLTGGGEIVVEAESRQRSCKE